MQEQIVSEVPQGPLQFIPDKELVSVTQTAVKIPILHPGRFIHREHGEFFVTLEHLQGMVDSYEDNGGSANPLETDYEHTDSSNARPPQSRKSGEVHGLSIENLDTPRYSGPALFASTIFTDHAKALIASGEITRVSADFSLAHQHEGVGPKFPFLFKFTLTNNDFLKTLPPITLSDTDNNSTPIQFIGNNNMSETLLAAGTKSETLSKVMKLLGMESDSTKEDLVARIASLAVGEAVEDEVVDEEVEELAGEAPAPTAPAPAFTAEAVETVDVPDSADEVKNLRFNLKAAKEKNDSQEIRLAKLEKESSDSKQELYENTVNSLVLSALGKLKITKELADHYRLKAYKYSANPRPIEDLEFELGEKAPAYGTKIPGAMVGHDSEVKSDGVPTIEDAIKLADEKGITNTEAFNMLAEG